LTGTWAGRPILHAAGVLAQPYNLILNIHDRAKHVRSASKFAPLNAPTSKEPMPSFSAMPREIPPSGASGIDFPKIQEG
jgi:hypothetical protein